MPTSLKDRIDSVTSQILSGKALIKGKIDSDMVAGDTFANIATGIDTGKNYIIEAFNEKFPQEPALTPNVSTFRQIGDALKALHYEQTINLNNVELTVGNAIYHLDTTKSSNSVEYVSWDYICFSEHDEETLYFMGSGSNTKTLQRYSNKFYTSSIVGDITAPDTDSDFYNLNCIYFNSSSILYLVYCLDAWSDGKTFYTIQAYNISSKTTSIIQNQISLSQNTNSFPQIRCISQDNSNLYFYVGGSSYSYGKKDHGYSIINKETFTETILQRREHDSSNDWNGFGNSCIFSEDKNVVYRSYANTSITYFEKYTLSTNTKSTICYNSVGNLYSYTGVKMNNNTLMYLYVDGTIDEDWKSCKFVDNKGAYKDMKIEMSEILDTRVLPNTNIFSGNQSKEYFYMYSNNGSRGQIDLFSLPYYTLDNKQIGATYNLNRDVYNNGTYVPAYQDFTYTDGEIEIRDFFGGNKISGTIRINV